MNKDVDLLTNEEIQAVITAVTAAIRSPQNTISVDVLTSAEMKLQRIAHKRPPKVINEIWPPLGGGR